MRHFSIGAQRRRAKRKNGWEAGIRTPIPWSRATCPTVGRPPNQVFPRRAETRIIYDSVPGLDFARRGTLRHRPREVFGGRARGVAVARAKRSDAAGGGIEPVPPDA